MTLAAGQHRKRVAERLMLICCLAALLMAVACAFLDFSPKWFLLPIGAAVVCAVIANPVTGIIEMLWGGRGGT